MKNLTQILSHSTTILMIWVFILLFPLLFIWQGGDLTDTGYHVSVYHFFFERIKQGYVESLFFLTEIVGALFYKFFPQFGVIGIKILSIIFLFPMLLMSYNVIKKKFGAHPLLPFLLLGGLIFSARSFPIIFNYDVFTAFWLIVLIFLLFNTHKLSPIKMLLSGFIIFLMTLSRVPNIVFLVLFPVSLLCFEFSKTVNEKIKGIFYLLVGFLIGTLLFILSVYYFNLQSIFVDQIKTYALLGDAGSSYNLTSLLFLYAKDLMVLLIYTVGIWIFIKLFQFIFKKLRHSEWIVLFAVLLFLIFLSFIPIRLDYYNPIKYIVPAVCIVFIILSKPKKSQLYFISLLIISALTQVAGSNTGITLKLNILSIIILPYSVVLFIQSKARHKYSLSYAFISYTLVFSFFLLLSGYYGVGFGLFNRLKFTHKIEVPHYHLIRTTISQKVVIDKLYTDLQSKKLSHDNLFIFGHKPMFYYLLNLTPATETYWLPGNKPTRISQIIKSLDGSAKTLILEEKNLKFLSKNNNDLEVFLKENNFSLVEQNENYNIWSNQIKKNDN